MFVFSHRFIFLIQFNTHVHGLVYFCRLHPTLSFRLYPVLVGGRHGARALESRMAYKFRTNEKNPKHAERNFDKTKFYQYKIFFFVTRRKGDRYSYTNYSTCTGFYQRFTKLAYLWLRIGPFQDMGQY